MRSDSICELLSLYFDNQNIYPSAKMKTDIQNVSVINDLLLIYKSEIELTTMKPLTKKMYTEHAQNFVRWISGDFVPGSRLKTGHSAEVNNQD